MEEVRFGEEVIVWYEGSWGWLRIEIFGCFVVFCSLGKFLIIVGQLDGGLNFYYGGLEGGGI